jgi:hypothetical protein
VNASSVPSIAGRKIGSFVGGWPLRRRRARILFVQVYALTSSQVPSETLDLFLTARIVL